MKVLEYFRNQNPYLIEPNENFSDSGESYSESKNEDENTNCENSANFWTKQKNCRPTKIVRYARIFALCNVWKQNNNRNGKRYQWTRLKTWSWQYFFLQITETDMKQFLGISLIISAYKLENECLRDFLIINFIKFLKLGILRLIKWCHVINIQLFIQT